MFARIAVVALLLLPLAGCANESSSEADDAKFPAEALATLHTDQGLSIEVRTSPDQPPSRGQSAALLSFLDSKGAVVDGLDVSAEPWMPAMGHGAATEPERVVLGDGKYRFDKVELFMPGEWELRITADGKTKDRATAHFQIR